MKETNLRFFFKSISWRFVATLITFTVAFILSGRIFLAIEIGILDSIMKIGAYILHEKLWSVIKIGKKMHPLADIELKRALNEKDKELIKEKLREMGYLD